MKLLGLLTLTVVMALLSFRQTLAWQSERSLWEEAVRASPQMPRAHLNLGIEYQKQGRMADAVRELERATELSTDPRRMPSHQQLSRTAAKSNLALMLLLRGKYAESLTISNDVLRESPDYRNAMINRGTAYLAMGDCHQAIVNYRAAGILEMPACP